MKRRLKQITVPNIGDTIILNCGYGGGPNETSCRIVQLGHCRLLFGEGYEITARVRILGTDEEFTTSLVS